MATDPRRLYDAKDMEGAILYVKRVSSSEDAYPLLANPDGSLIVSLTSGSITIDPPVQSTLNTSTTPLASTATFTGSFELNDFPDVMVSCFADNGGTLYFDFSPDGTNYTTFPTNGFTITANVHDLHIASKGPRYFRVRLVNNSGAQSTLRLYTYYGAFSKLNAPLNQSITNDAEAQLVRAVIAGETTAGGGGFVNVKVNPSGTIEANTTLSSTVVTSQISSTSSVVTAHLSPSTTKVTVDNTITASLSSTVVTSQISSVSSTVTVHISPSASVVTVKSSVAGFNVNVATATLGTVVTSFSSTLVTSHISPSASVVTVHLSPSASAATVAFSNTRVTATLISGQTSIDGGAGASGATTVRVVRANDEGRTLTRATGSLSATIGSITFTPTNGAKIYGYSLSTTSASEVICIFYDGGFSTARELWRVTLMAPSGANSGANLAVSPPGWLFKSRTASAVCLSLSTAVLVHYSVAYFDEA